MELDVWIEALQLAVEYQGEQHYKPIYWKTNDLPQQQRRDQEKRIACKQVIASDLFPNNLFPIAQYHVD